MANRSPSFRVTGSGSSPHDRAVMGALALHAQYSKGNETSTQIAAQEANLVYANALRDTVAAATSTSTRVRGTKSHPLPNPKSYKKATTRGSEYGKRFQDGSALGGLRPLPRGTRFVAYDAVKAPKAATISGKFPKFISDISPVRFDTRTSWGRARKASGFIQIVTPRKKRLAHQKNWSHRGHMWVPR